MQQIDNQTIALQQTDELQKAGAISILVGGENYVTCKNEIADTTSRRELEAILVRTGVFKTSQHLSKNMAADLCTALSLTGIHMDQWLSDRKYQSDFDELKDLLADYAKHGDLNANDTRLRILVTKLVKKHLGELQKTMTAQPLDSSIHVVRIKNKLTAKGIM